VILNRDALVFANEAIRQLGCDETAVLFFGRRPLQEDAGLIDD
jgi:hypothetical protein